MSPALEFRSVSFSYGPIPVFDRLSLTVGDGEMVGLLGPNGSGKSTLLRLASASRIPRSGTVALYGRGLPGLPHAERARTVAVVPQDAEFAFDFTVQEVVALGRAPHQGLLGTATPHDREAVAWALEVCSLGLLSGRRVHTLSGGERQRVLLARAVAQEPRLLLLDEPTAHLDLRHQVALYALLRDLHARGGLTVLLVSHEINLAARHCPRLVLLDAGQVAGDGPPGEVLRADTLSRVYGTEVRVLRDPATGGPLISP